MFLCVNFSMDGKKKREREKVEEITKRWKEKKRMKGRKRRDRERKIEKRYIDRLRREK